MKRVVSLPVHESEVAAIDLCLNYILVGEVDAVIVHVNALARDFNVQHFTTLVDTTEPLRGKVFVTPQRLPIPRIGGIGLFMAAQRAHMVNFAYANSFLQFDWFLLDAADSLIVKRGLAGYVDGDEDGIESRACGEHGLWMDRVRQDVIWEMFKGKISHSFMDGAFFRRDAFNRMMIALLAYERFHGQSLASGKALQEFPRDEILISTAYRAVGGGKPTKAPYIWTRWETRLQWQPTEVQSMLRMQHVLHSKYGVRGVSADANDWLRVAVGQYYGYRALTEAAHARYRMLTGMTVFAPQVAPVEAPKVEAQKVVAPEATRLQKPPVPIAPLPPPARTVAPERPVLRMPQNVAPVLRPIN